MLGSRYEEKVRFQIKVQIEQQKMSLDKNSVINNNKFNI